jgi:hypothetical protein
MPPRNFQVAVLVRLGLPVDVFGKPLMFMCMQTIDVFGDHARMLH